MKNNRLEHLEQLFLEAGAVLYRTLAANGMRYHHEKGGEIGVHLAHESNLQRWCDGIDFTYRVNGITRDVTLGTLKDACMAQTPCHWEIKVTPPQEEPMDSTVHPGDRKEVSPFEEGENYARMGWGVDGNPYITYACRMSFIQGYHAYQRRMAPQPEPEVDHFREAYINPRSGVMYFVKNDGKVWIKDGEHSTMRPFLFDFDRVVHKLEKLLFCSTYYNGTLL